jgi:hypothetical protein
MEQEGEWIVVDEIAGPGLASILMGLLAANGVQAMVSEPGAWEAFPTTFGQLGTYQILVRAVDEADARDILEAFYANQIEIEPGSNVASDSDEQPENEDVELSESESDEQSPDDPVGN